ncbi:MAG TPA: hypothetical protein VN706_12575 [Gemmatimonadaceae bacterium]|nr:hypothetical protein [Gemmatimonadaceae bacterium]
MTLDFRGGLSLPVALFLPEYDEHVIGLNVLGFERLDSRIQRVGSNWLIGGKPAPSGAGIAVQTTTGRVFLIDRQTVEAFAAAELRQIRAQRPAGSYPPISAPSANTFYVTAADSIQPKWVEVARLKRIREKTPVR